MSRRPGRARMCGWLSGELHNLAGRTMPFNPADIKQMTYNCRDVDKERNEMPEDSTKLPTEISVTVAGTTLTLPVRYGTAIREEDGEVWDHEPLWYPGDKGSPEDLWRLAQEQFDANPDPEQQTLILVWRVASEADVWIEFPTRTRGRAA